MIGDYYNLTKITFIKTPPLLQTNYLYSNNFFGNFHNKFHVSDECPKLKGDYHLCVTIERKRLLMWERCSVVFLRNHSTPPISLKGFSELVMGSGYQVLGLWGNNDKKIFLKYDKNQVTNSQKPWLTCPKTYFNSPWNFKKLVYRASNSITIMCAQFNNKPASLLTVYFAFQNWEKDDIFSSQWLGTVRKTRPW